MTMILHPHSYRALLGLPVEDPVSDQTVEEIMAVIEKSFDFTPRPRHPTYRNWNPISRDFKPSMISLIEKSVREGAARREA